MFRLSRTFWLSKTTWTALAAVVTAVGGILTKQVPLFQGLGAIYAALSAAFLRDTIAKTTEGGDRPGDREL